MCVGDLVSVTKSGFGIRAGCRGIITQLIEYTRYSAAKPKAVPSAIVLFTTGTVILPLSALSSVGDSSV